jgi:DNA-binding transcriptional ArsR family regulator
MARAATTTDAFNAVAEPRRRQLIDLLVGGERTVTELVQGSGLTQPQVSKHLRVLREVALVQSRDSGRLRLYRLNGVGLKPIHDWISRFQETWNERYDALDAVLDDLKRQEADDAGDA